MAIVSQLLHTWGQAGYLQWLSNLRDSYELRRNIMCAALAKQFVALPAEQYASQVPGCEGVALYPRGTDPATIKPDQVPVASFVAPAGGMCVSLSLLGTPESSADAASLPRAGSSGSASTSRARRGSASSRPRVTRTQRRPSWTTCGRRSPTTWCVTASCLALALLALSDP